jgi:hypothetical protein
VIREFVVFPPFSSLPFVCCTDIYHRCVSFCSPRHTYGQRVRREMNDSISGRQTGRHVTCIARHESLFAQTTCREASVFCPLGKAYRECLPVESRQELTPDAEIASVRLTKSVIALKAASHMRRLELRSAKTTDRGGTTRDAGNEQ